MKIIGVGDCVLDEYVHQKHLYPGGNSVNVPVLAKRAGSQSAAYIGILGTDQSSQQFRNYLISEQIDISRIRIAEGPMARNFIKLDSSGDRSFVGNNGDNVVQKMLRLQLNEQDISLIRQYDVLHTSFHSEIDEIIPKSLGNISISLDFSDAYDQKALQKYCPGIDFVFLSAGKFNEKYTDDCIEIALESGAKMVILTQGVRGSTIITKKKKHIEPATSIKTVDTLGAGDAYIAGYLEAYYTSEGNIQVAARMASEFAAKNCLHNGASGVFFPS